MIQLKFPIALLTTAAPNITHVISDMVSPVPSAARRNSSR